METRPKEWLEGRQAFMDGIDESKCPYSMDRDIRRWSNWVSGHSEARDEEFVKQWNKPN